MKWPGRSLNILFPFKISIIVIIVILPLFVFSYLVVDRFVVRQKIGDLMNLADTKYIHVLDLLDFGKKVNGDWASNPTLNQSLSDYERNKSEKALTVIQNDLIRIKDVGALLRPHAFGLKPLTKNRFSEVLITDNKGKVIASTNKSSVSMNLSKTAIFHEKDTKTFVSDVFRNPQGVAVFAFVSPILKGENKRGPVLGYLVTEVDTALLTMIMNGDLGNIIGGKLWFAGFQWRSMDIYIMDKKGLMITQSRVIKKDTVLKQKGSELPLERGLFGGKGERDTMYGLRTGAREVMEVFPNRQGINVAGASMYLFDNGWTVVVEQATKDAFGGLYFLKIALIMGGLFAAFLAVLITWKMTKRITNSLADMGTASVKLASGDLDAQMKIRPGEYNEIEVLASSLNIMAQNLKETTEAEPKEKQ